MKRFLRTNCSLGLMLAVGCGGLITGCGLHRGRMGNFLSSAFTVEAHSSQGGSAEVATMESRVRAQAETAAPQAEPVGDVFKTVARRPGKAGSWPLQLEQGRCYWFSAVAEPRVARLELTLRDRRNRRVARKRINGQELLFDFCPQTSAAYRLVARVEKGRGELALGVFSKLVPATAEPGDGALDDERPSRRAAPVAEDDDGQRPSRSGASTAELDDGERPSKRRARRD